MPLKTRQNPQTGTLEVEIGGVWEAFDEYRKRQIDDAYQSSIRFLRDRLGEENTGAAGQKTDKTDSKNEATATE